MPGTPDAGPGVPSSRAVSPAVAASSSASPTRPAASAAVPPLPAATPAPAPAEAPFAVAPHPSPASVTFGHTAVAPPGIPLAGTTPAASLTERSEPAGPAVGGTLPGGASPAASPASASPIDGAPNPPEWLKRRPSHMRVGLPLPAMAPPSPLPPDFSGSWWGRDDGPAAGPAHAPVPVPIPQPIGAGAHPAVTVSEEAVVERVLAALGRQIDEQFEDRLHEVMVPALARLTDALMAELRGQLSSSLRETVRDAVAVELARLSRGGSPS